jgi:MSHA biogenesis protein MshP
MTTTPLASLQHRNVAARNVAVRQRGASIISAIFMLLLFAALAAFMVSLTSTANVTSAQDVQGARAYQAAQAGLEIGLYNVLVSPATGCTFPSPPNIEGFSITLSCSSDGPYTDSGATFSIYKLTSLAKTSAAVGSPAFIEREVSAYVNK